MKLLSTKHTVAVWLGLIVLLATGLRLYGLDRFPLWQDEAYSVWFASQTFADIWTTTRNIDTHPPLYYTLLRAWSVFGDSETALRGLSVVLSVATVPAIFLFGRIVGGPSHGVWTGLGAALLFALSPVQLRFAQEARPYAGLVFAVTVALCGIAWLMRHPDAARRPVFGLTMLNSETTNGLPGARVPLAWLVAIVGTSLALWFHTMAAFFVMALALAAVLWMAWQRNWSLAFVANGVLAGLALLVLWSPYLPWLFVQIGTVSRGLWMQAPGVRTVADAADLIFGVSYLWAYVSMVPLAVLAAVGLWALGRRGKWPLAIVLATLTVAPFALEVVASYLFRPLFLNRTLIWTNVPFLVLLVVGLTPIRPARLRSAALAALAVLLLLGSASFFANYKSEEWDRVAALVAENAGPRDIVLLLPNDVELPLFPHLRRARPDLSYVPLPRPFPAPGLPNPYPSGVAGVPGMTAANVPALRERLRASGPVWLIERGMQDYDPDSLVLGVLRETRKMVTKWRFKGAVVYRFE